MNNIIPIISEKKLQIDAAIEHMVTSAHFDKKVEEIVRYNLFPGGKRLRPLLTIFLYELLRDKSPDWLVPYAAAIELFHTSTLMLDDLPCMDNSPSRRGKTTSHIVFGEHNTILVSMGLANESFAWLAKSTEHVPANTITTLLQAVTQKIGLNGLLIGQIFDLDKHQETDVKQKELLDFITLNKTAALFEVCALVASYLADSTQLERNNIINYTRNFGYAFQIIDDLKDIDEDTNLTFPRVYGISQSRIIAKQSLDQACKSLESFGNRAQLLIDIAQHLAAKTA